jgi:hypothetical protein
VSHECLGSFSTRLVVHATLPLAMLIVITLITLAAVLLRRRMTRPSFHCRAALYEGMELAVSAALFLLFCAVPAVTNQIFAAFACDGFHIDDDTVHFYLHADYRTRCYGHEHMAHIVPVAVVGLLLWPIGVPLFFGRLLMAARRVEEENDERTLLMRSGRWQSVLRSVRFLHADYHPEFMWWECVPRPSHLRPSLTPAPVPHTCARPSHLRPSLTPAPVPHTCASHLRPSLTPAPPRCATGCSS